MKARNRKNQRTFVLLNGRKKLHPYLVWWFHQCHMIGAKRERCMQASKRGPGRKSQYARVGTRPSKIARILRRQRWAG